MHELICPNCKKPFAVNEDDYAAILSQVKGAEFNAEVDRRIAELHKQQEAEQRARDAQAGQEHQKELDVHLQFLHQLHTLLFLQHPMYYQHYQDLFQP